MPPASRRNRALARAGRPAPPAAWNPREPSSRSGPGRGECPRSPKVVDLFEPGPRLLPARLVAKRLGEEGAGLVAPADLQVVLGQHQHGADVVPPELEGALEPAGRGGEVAAPRADDRKVDVRV